MKFEELETVWALQPASVTAVADVTTLKRAVMPELKRRGRMLRYGVFMATFGLLILPTLAVANYRYARPANPTWHWVDLAFWMAVNFTALVFLIREVRRQRTLLRQSADTVRALTTLSLASREAEMADFRRGLWVVPALLAFHALSLYLKFPVTAHGWSPFALRAAATVGVTLLMCSVFWRHYQVNLKPDQARQKEILRELSAE